MSNHYYSIKDATKVGRGPVRMIMKTTGYSYLPPGLYALSYAIDPNKFVDIVVTHISRWDYDMLDAVGVEVMEYSKFNAKYQRMFA